MTSDKHATRTDEELMKWIVLGDESAFAVLFARHSRMTLSFAFRILQDHGQAENVVQEAFLRIFREADSYQHPRPFKAWFHAILRNLLKNELRSQMRAKTIPESQLPTDGTGDDTHPRSRMANHPDPAMLSPDQAAELTETQERLHMALQALSDEDRECFYLHRFDGLKYREIASVLEIPIGTVRSRIHRVMKTIEENFIPG